MRADELRIGVLLPLWTGSYAGATATLPQLLTFARHAEAVGFDSLWFTDHL